MLCAYICLFLDARFGLGTPNTYSQISIMQSMIDFLTQNGIPQYATLWILMLPIAATVVVVSRQIIGIKGFGITMPVLFGFSFASTGLEMGIMIMLIVLLSGYLIRSLLNNVRLLYLPKTALVITGAAVTALAVSPLLPYSKEFQFPLAAFALVIFVLSLEQFYAFLSERGLKKTTAVTIETLALSIIVFLITTWELLQGLVIDHPILTILAVVATNLFLGKWTGLRLSEYIRFKDVIFK